MELLTILGIIVLIAVLMNFSKKEMLAKMTPAQREEYFRAKEYSRLNTLHGNLNPSMICPHCRAVGQIRTKAVTHKKGISGGKATAALFTGGLTMLATGLSRKENLTQAHCANCNNVWGF